MAMEKKGKIQDFLRDSLKNRKAILGISGGIDSALTLMILTKIKESRDILAFYMPESNTNKKDLNDIKELEIFSGVKIKNIFIGDIVDSYGKALAIGDVKALGNIKSRIRMSILYYYSNLTNGIVVGTTNYTEYITGYYTKFGDGGCDIEPIIDLTKTEVREFAKYFQVPQNIIDKPPTAGLWENQTDEGDLGYTYEEIDNEIEIFRNTGSFTSSEVARRVKDLYDQSAHKRLLPAKPEMNIK
jgi:NAD+ synthase